MTEPRHFDCSCARMSYPAVPSIEPSRESLRVRFADGHHADFHWFWLRHECALDRHPTTQERTNDASRISLDLTAQSVALETDAVVVRWANEPDTRPASRYALSWLREHAYALDLALVPLPPSDPAILETSLDADGLLPADFLARLDAHGAILARDVHGIAASPEATERLITQLDGLALSVIGTHFGRIEDLRTDNTTNQNTDQLGYTDAPIELHTDQPFLDGPPRYQMLHCVRPAETGGENTLGDARAAAEYVASTDEETSRLVREVPVRFHRKQRAFERLFEGPIVRGEGAAFQVRLSPFTMAPHALRFDAMKAWYRAYGHYVGLLNEHHYTFRLGPGDVLLYDNHRMVHGRTGFRGARWVRGVYFDRVAA